MFNKQQADEQYKDAGFYQSLAATTTPDSTTTTLDPSKQTPTLFPGVASSHSIVIIVVIVAFVLTLLCAVTAVTLYTCCFCHGRQKQASAGMLLQYMLSWCARLLVYKLSAYCRSKCSTTA